MKQNFYNSFFIWGLKVHYFYSKWLAVGTIPGERFI